MDFGVNLWFKAGKTPEFRTILCPSFFSQRHRLPLALFTFFSLSLFHSCPDQTIQGQLWWGCREIWDLMLVRTWDLRLDRIYYLILVKIWDWPNSDIWYWPNMWFLHRTTQRFKAWPDLLHSIFSQILIILIMTFLIIIIIFLPKWRFFCSQLLPSLEFAPPASPAPPCSVPASSATQGNGFCVI